MRLFLASSINCTINEFARVVSDQEKRVLFINNAADLCTGDKPWIKADRDAFEDLNFYVQELDLRTVSLEEFKVLLSNFSILHVGGGSIYYLASILCANGFDKAIIDAVVSDSIIYTGSSAGAIVASASFKPFSNEPEELDHVKLHPDHKGLGFVNFCVVPHCDSPDFVSSNKKIIEELPVNKEALFFLQDKHALWIQNAKIQLCVAS